jgi:hypothetical protein
MQRWSEVRLPNFGNFFLYTAKLSPQAQERLALGLLK